MLVPWRAFHLTSEFTEPAEDAEKIGPLSGAAWRTPHPPLSYFRNRYAKHAFAPRHMRLSWPGIVGRAARRAGLAIPPVHAGMREQIQALPPSHCHKNVTHLRE